MYVSVIASVIPFRPAPFVTSLSHPIVLVRGCRSSPFLTNSDSATLLQIVIMCALNDSHTSILSFHKMIDESIKLRDDHKDNLTMYM